MFYERIPAGGTSGRTPAQIFDRYGLPHRRADLLQAILKLPQNEALLRASGGKIALDTDLTTFAGRMARGVASLCLPIDYQVAHQGKTVVNLNGLRAQRIDKPGLFQLCRHWWVPVPTHGVDVRFALVFGAAPLVELENQDAHRCRNVRWLQTVKTRNRPYPQIPSTFVDVANPRENDDVWPWYDSGESANAGGQIELTDKPGGPEGKTAAPRYHFLATTSCAVRTESRVTLIQCFTWGFEVRDGRTEAAVLWNPSIRPATEAEIQEQLRILKTVAISPCKEPTGGHHEYRPPPASGSINE